MRTANLVSGIVLILFGLIMLWLVIPAQIEEGPEGMMSPRLVPQMMLWLIVGLSLLLIVTNLRAAPSDDDGTPPISGAELRAFASIGGLFVLALVLFLSFGALPASAVLIVGALLVLGERRPMVLVLMPLFLIGGAYLLFYRVLGTVIV